MKKLSIFLFTVFALTLFAVHAEAAVTPTKTTLSPTPDKNASASANTLEDKLNQQINNLKDKIASRVTELNLVEKRGIIGIVSAVQANQVTVTDIAGKTRFVDVDEITKFSSASAKGSFGLSDLTKGTKISVLGLYNKQSKRILARFISTSVDPVFLNGVITDLDKKAFTLTLASEDQKQTSIDVENITKILTYNKIDGLTKYGFSKMGVGDSIFVVGFPDKKDKTLIIASRVIDIPDLPKNGKIVIPEVSAVASPSATGKLSPAPTVGLKKVIPTK